VDLLGHYGEEARDLVENGIDERLARGEVDEDRRDRHARAFGDLGMTPPPDSPVRKDGQSVLEKLGTTIGWTKPAARAWPSDSSGHLPAG
jgi:hypothetical protein